MQEQISSHPSTKLEVPAIENQGIERRNCASGCHYSEAQLAASKRFARSEHRADNDYRSCQMVTAPPAEHGGQLFFSNSSKKRHAIELAFGLCEHLGVAVATGTGGAAIYWYGHDASYSISLAFKLLGAVVILFGLILAGCASGIFIQDMLGHKPGRLKTLLLSAPLVVVAAAFFVAVVKVGVASIVH